MPVASTYDFWYEATSLDSMEGVPEWPRPGEKILKGGGTPVERLHAAFDDVSAGSITKPPMARERNAYSRSPMSPINDGTPSFWSDRAMFTPTRPVGPRIRTVRWRLIAAWGAARRMSISLSIH